MIFKPSNLLSVLLILVICFISGCSMGPKMLKTSTGSYNIMASQSNNEQMLLNLVRLRYLESPYFIQLGSISTSYNFGLSGGAKATIPDGRVKEMGLISLYEGMIGGEYNEYPTFTYVPLQGKEYVEYLVKDMGMEQFAMLKQTNWNLSLMMQLMVKNFGHLHNDSMMDEVSFEKFINLTKFLSKISMRGDLSILRVAGSQEGTLLCSGIDAEKVTPGSIMEADKAGYSFKKTKDSKKLELHKTTRTPYWALQIRFNNNGEADKLEDLFNVKADRLKLKDGRIVCSYALISRNDLSRESSEDSIPMIHIGFRSLIDMMYQLAANVVPPAQDLERGVAPRLPDNLNTTHSTLKVLNSKSYPKDAYVAIKYRDTWFYVDDRDALSKQLFGFMTILFSLQSSNQKTMEPLITIPARN
jgi:hypothetical protein